MRISSWRTRDYAGTDCMRTQEGILPRRLDKVRRIAMISCLGSIASALLFALLVLGSMGCGDDDGAPAGATCTGEGCTCSPTNECTCTSGDDCKAMCEECSLTCEKSAKCNAEATRAVTVECNDSSECKGNGGDGSTLTCIGSAYCELKGGADSAATCRDSSDCKINLGPRSTVDCMDSAHCDIKCDDGDCEVSCGRDTQCALNCGEEAGGKSGTECTDGRLICGTGC